MKIEFVLLARVAVLEIGAAGAADQQRVAGEHAIAHQVAVGIVGVAGRIEHVQREPLDRQFLALREPHRDDVGLGLLTHHGDAVRAVAQRAEPGDVIGMEMRVDRFHELEVELADELEIAVDLLQDGIDDQRLAAASAGEQIGVGAGYAVEQLAEDHDRVSLPPTLAHRRKRNCGAQPFTTGVSGRPPHSTHEPS